MKITKIAVLKAKKSNVGNFETEDTSVWIEGELEQGDDVNSEITRLMRIANKNVDKEIFELKKRL